MRPFVCCLVATCLCIASASAEDMAGIALQIKNANLDYAKSLTSFHVEFKLGPSEDPKSPLPDFVWTHARSGQQEVFFTDPSSPEYATFGRVWSGTDGKDGMNMVFAVFDPQRVQRVDRFPDRRPRWLDESPISRALGWSCLEFGSITSLMETADKQDLVREPAKICVSPEETREFPAVRWRLRKFRDREDLPEHEIVVWFSEYHGWLPRNIMVAPVGLFEKKGNVQFTAGSRINVVAIAEFSEIQDPQLGKPRHFPKTIRRSARGWETVNVTSAILNRPVDKAVLRSPAR